MVLVNSSEHFYKVIQQNHAPYNRQKNYNNFNFNKFECSDVCVVTDQTRF